MAFETGAGTIQPEIGIESDDEMIRRGIMAEFEERGVFGCPKEVITHFAAIEKNSKFNKASRVIQKGVENVTTNLERENKGALQLTPQQKKEAALAAFVHDIGKSSSSEDPACQLAAVRLFEAPVVNQNQTVSAAVDEFFPSNEKDVTLSNLQKIQVTPDMTMRSFWDKHAFWTNELLDRFPSVFSEMTRSIAASHHIDRGINPRGINENKISREIKILMAIDKYQANISRGGATHEEAMEYLRKDLISYERDSVMASILKTIDELGSAGTLFL